MEAVTWMVKLNAKNNLGLSHDGKRVVREAMTKGMLITIEHTSSVARKHIHQLAVRDFKGYPLNALHNKPNSRLNQRKRLQTA